MTHPNAGHGLPQKNNHPVKTTSRAKPAKLAAKRTSIWFSIFGTFLIMLLLLSFQQVVQGAVNKSAERHKSTALLVKAARMCKDLRDAGASDRCSQQLDSSSNGTGVKDILLVSF